MKVQQSLKWILHNWVELIAGICISLASIICIVNVFMRYLLPRYAFVGAEEIITLFISWVVFIGGAAAYKCKMLFAIDMFINLLPARVRYFISYLVKIFILVVSFYISYLGWIFAKAAWIKTTATLLIPYFYIDIPIAIGFFLIAYYTLRDIICDIIKVFTNKKLVTADTGQEAMEVK